jgi:hypothetical protein
MSKRRDYPAHRPVYKFKGVKDIQATLSNSVCLFDRICFMCNLRMAQVMLTHKAGLEDLNQWVKGC